MEKQAGDGGVTLPVDIVVGNVLGDQIGDFHKIGANEAHDSKGGGHHFGNWGNIVQGGVGDNWALNLVVIGEMSEVFAVDDMGFIGNCDAATWKNSVSDGLFEKIVNFGPICV